MKAHDTLTNEQKTKLNNMFLRHKNVLIDKYGNLGFVGILEHHIKLTPDAKPFARRPYRTNTRSREAISQYVKKMLNRGVDEIFMWCMGCSHFNCLKRICDV